MRNGGLPREVCATELCCSSVCLSCACQNWRFASRGERNGGIIKSSVAHTSRGKPRFAEVCLNTGFRKWRFASRGERNRGIIKGSVAHTSRGKPPFLPRYRNTEIPRYRDIEIPLCKVRVGSRYDPPYELEKGGDFIDKLV